MDPPKRDKFDLIRVLIAIATGLIVALILARAEAQRRIDQIPEPGRLGKATLDHQNREQQHGQGLPTENP